MSTKELPEYLESGDVARLIPVVAETSKERRAASILLATMMAVDEFAAAMLRGVDVRLGARAKVQCFTEVVFRDAGPGAKLRPDGLIFVNTGKKTWTALVETKIGNADIDAEQLTAYIQLAKQHGIDAVITLSNQFAALPDHHPVEIPKAATKGVGLFHWSWMYMLTQATLLLHDNEFTSADQRYILGEMVRFFGHSSSGVSSFDRMNADWKALVMKVHTDAPLSRALPEVERSVASWHQEERDLCLIMSRKLGREVHLKLSRSHISDPAKRMRDDCDELVQSKSLACSLEIPNAAAPLLISAHLARRTITCCMKLQAPRDKKRTPARLNWLIRQLSSSDPEAVFITANWPGRTKNTQAALDAVRANPGCLEVDNGGVPPVAFEVTMVRDLAGKFSGAKTFIERLEEFVPEYYENVGQHLRAWVAPPPKLIETSAEEDAIVDHPSDVGTDTAVSPQPGGRTQTNAVDHLKNQ